MSVTLTEKAAAEVKRRLESEHADAGTMLRLGVAAGGCSGFQYQLVFDRQYDENVDDKFDCHGVGLVVDKKSSLYLEGTVVDYHDGLQGGHGFSINNPTVVKSCGCGNSFQA
jgi:iron-sulfur cluster assembly protein